MFHIKGFTPQQAVPIAQSLLQRKRVTISDENLEKLFASKLLGEETELSLRQIGRIVDRLVMLNTQTPPPPPQKGIGLRLV